MDYTRMKRLDFGPHLNNEAFADVKLFVGGDDEGSGKYLQCHKVILSVASPYFRRAFEDDPSKEVVILGDVRYEILTSVLEFIYTGSAKISEDDLADFKEAAAGIFQLEGFDQDQTAQFQADDTMGELTSEAAATTSVKIEPGTSGGPPRKKIKKEEAAMPTPNVKKEPVKTNQPPKIAKLDSGLFQCILCLKICKTLKAARTHHQEAHVESAETFSCEYCGKAFKIKRYLAQHLNGAHKITQKMLKNIVT